MADAGGRSDATGNHRPGGAALRCRCRVGRARPRHVHRAAGRRGDSAAAPGRRRGRAVRRSRPIAGGDVSGIRLRALRRHASLARHRPGARGRRFRLAVAQRGRQRESMIVASDAAPELSLLAATLDKAVARLPAAPRLYRVAGDLVAIRAGDRAAALLEAFTPMRANDDGDAVALEIFIFDAVSDELALPDTAITH